MSSLSPSRRARSPNVLNFTSPGNSPGRPQRLIQEGLLKAEDPAYKSAMEKIYEASWKFDRAKNEDLMKTLDNRELLPEQFRQMLKAGMNCRFTNEEFEAIFPIFDNHGFVDGTEFIMLFYRYRYEHREQLLKARAETNRRRHELEKAIKEKQAEDLENKRILELVDDFTPADEKSALDKLINAAVKYDRLMPGAVPLDAFDVEKMNPGEFREQMKSVFKVNFTLRELSAFIAYFNRDKNPSDKSVNCAAFLVTFFRMGFRERSNRLHEIWAEKKRVAEEKAKKIKEEEEELAQKNALKVNFVFTPEDRERAIVKLRTAAKLYDKTTPGAMSMKSFEVKEMAPHVFKEQLRRIFNLQVTPAEMGALMTVFDVNGDGVITCEEFTKVFINMGFEEREKELKEAREKQKQYEEYRKLQEMKKKQELESKNALKVSYQFTPEEFNTAMQKLIEAAWRYDKTMPGAASLEAFEAQYMEAHILKDQLKKAFHIKLSPQELGAIMNYFDTENTGKIHCSSFLKKFFRVGYEERQRKKELWRIHQKNLIEKRLEEEKQKLENLSMKNSVVLSSAAASIAAKANASINGGAGGDNNTNNDPNLSSSLSAITPSVPGQDFTEKDFQNAFFKLTLGAIKYDRSLPNAMNLTAFECISMPPHIFREQLKLTFNVKVTVPELWALVSYFDKDHTGEINCKTFINQFLRTGYEERNRIKEQWRIMKLMKEEEMKQKEFNDLKYKEEMAYKECDFDFNESEFNSILFRFVIMCHTIDKRTIGPAGLTAFESESLNPSEFREMLKRTFNFKVNNKELGALVNYFDVLGKKVVHCPTFINSFTQIRGHCDDFKGKPDEHQKLLQYVLGLKESYRHRVAKNPSVEARPWRQQNAISSFHGNKKIFKKKDPKPLHDPLEKYRLRVLIGRKTGRMDLTTKAFWPPKPSEDELAQGNSRSPSPAGSRQSKSRKSRHSVRRSRSPSPSASIRSLNSEQLIEDDEKEKEDGEEDKENQEGDEGENEKVEGSVKQPSVTIKLDDINPSPRSGLFADIAMTSRTRGISQRSLSVDEEKSMADDKSVHSMLSMNSGIKDEPIEVPTSLPVEEELEFRLNVIPPEIFRITDLRELWLDNHCINFIPSEINQLKNLQLLSIKNNQLEILPTQICDLMHLNKCYFNNNLLTVLPNLFWKCSSLQEINLSNNQFQEFPEVITAITSLRVVELSNNYIKDLPKSLYHMKSLQFLFLEKNEFISPPLILSRLPWVNVSGCPIPVDSKSASSLTITPSEEYELLGMLKGRAAVKITSKLRRRKKKTNYLS